MKLTVYVCPCCGAPVRPTLEAYRTTFVCDYCRASGAVDEQEIYVQDAPYSYPMDSSIQTTNYVIYRDNAYWVK